MTTSYVREQAYKEILEDGHPLIIISGSDIARIVIDVGYNTRVTVHTWLQNRFPYESCV